MQFYWYTKSIPELAGLPTDERRSRWIATRWKVFRHWQLWIVAFTVGPLFGLGLTLIESLPLRLVVMVAVLFVLGVLLRPIEVHLRRLHLP
ncbi:MAG: hypothetical protein V3W14_12470 [Candidatus Neomarinimicrobiota bacterium]